MALASFQRALFDLIAQPALCMQAKENPGILSDRYELTPKEFSRLNSVIRQKGMATNCTLYRINRVTPLYTLLPYTCKLLGNDLLPLLIAFWEKNGRTNLQFKDEVLLFAQYLQTAIVKGAVQIPFLEEILNFEDKINELRYQKEESEPHEISSIYTLNPVIRIVRFRHHPQTLFDLLTSDEPVTAATSAVPAGQYYLLLEQTGDEIDMKVISTELGYILDNIGSYKALPRELLETGLVRERVTVQNLNTRIP